VAYTGFLCKNGECRYTKKKKVATVKNLCWCNDIMYCVKVKVKAFEWVFNLLMVLLILWS
jgi:hypothetical protein